MQVQGLVVHYHRLLAWVRTHHHTFPSALAMQRDWCFLGERVELGDLTVTVGSDPSQAAALPPLAAADSLVLRVQQHVFATPGNSSTYFRPLSDAQDSAWRTSRNVTSRFIMFGACMGRGGSKALATAAWHVRSGLGSCRTACTGWGCVHSGNGCRDTCFVVASAPGAGGAASIWLQVQVQGSCARSRE